MDVGLVRDYAGRLPDGTQIAVAGSGYVPLQELARFRCAVMLAAARLSRHWSELPQPPQTLGLALPMLTNRARLAPIPQPAPRYTLALDGITASSRLGRLLTINSPVLKQVRVG